MAKCNDQHTQDRKANFGKTVRQRQRSGHHAKPERANPDRHGKPMLEDTAAKAKSAERHGDRQAELMQMRIHKYPASRCQHGDQDSRCKAMRKAQARYGYGDTVYRPVSGNLREQSKRILQQMRDDVSLHIKTEVRMQHYVCRFSLILELIAVFLLASLPLFRTWRVRA